MNHKEKLKQHEPIIYRALENACQKKRMSHAYLFSGPSGTTKKEVAMLLAKSIFCDSDGLACEECEVCRRVEKGEYADFFVLDGSKDSISKKEVDLLQSELSKTALEEGNGKRVYIIYNIENATIAAQNSMLKFLEEPSKDVIAILTTDNINRIIPTIVSRCTTLSLLPMTKESQYEELIEKGIDEEEAYFLSYLTCPIDSYEEFIESKEYINGKQMLKQYLNLEGLRREELLIDYDISWSIKDGSKANKASNQVLLSIFFDLLSLYGHDAIKHDGKGPTWYHEAVVKPSGKEVDYARLITIVNEEKNHINKYNDLNLVLAKTFYRLEELNNERSL